jgi:hypothetical protein
VREAHNPVAASGLSVARVGKETSMQRLFGRVTAHFLGSAALHSGPVTPAAASEPPETQRAANTVERLLDRWESSPDLLGEEKTQDALVIAFFGAFSLIGWLMVVQGCEQLRQAHAIGRWPTAEGTVMAVDVQAVDSGEGARWRPQVTYSYSVGNRVITATRITQGKARTSTTRPSARLRPQLPAAGIRYGPLQPGPDHRVRAGAHHAAQRLPESLPRGLPGEPGPGAVHADRHARLPPSRLAVLAAALAFGGLAG